MTMGDELGDRIRAIVGEMSPLGPRVALPEHRMTEDLGFDSLATLELTTALEEEFGLEPIDEEVAMEILTVADLEKLIRHSGASAG